jgi:hypothetical protein
MMHRSFLSASILCAALVIGCEKKEEPKPSAAPTTPAMPSSPASPAPGANKTLPDLSGMKDQATTQMQGMQAQGQQALQGAQAKITDSDLLKSWQAKLDEVKAAIASGKWTDADTILKGVESMKAQLPQNMQDQIDTYRKQINEAMARVKTPTH